MEKEEKWQIRGVRRPPLEIDGLDSFLEIKKKRKLKNFNGNYSRSSNVII